MSVRVSSIVWDTDFPTQSMKLIALKLADNSSDSGDSIYPAKDTIAEMTGCSRSTVHSVIADFCHCGVLVEVERGGKGPGHTTHYRFDMEKLWALSAGVYSFSKDEASGKLTVIENKGPENGLLDELRVQPLDERVQPLDKKGPAIGPEPSINRQEPSRMRASVRPARAKRGEEPPPALIPIKPETPQWAAWRAYTLRKIRKPTAPMDGREFWMVPSEFPPVDKGGAR